MKKTSPLYRFVWQAHCLIRKGYMNSVRLVSGVDKNKVVFTSFQSSAYNDNPRYISERLHELRPGTDIVWLYRKGAREKVDAPDYVRRVPAIGRVGLREQATARVWVDNYTRNDSYALSRKQFYINTWHGDRGFKRIALDDERIRWKQKRMEHRCALAIAGSDFGENVFRSAFGYRGEVMKEGMPRNDILLRGDPEAVRRVRSGLGIPEGARVFLYAPTFRDGKRGEKQAVGIDLMETLRILEERDGCGWVCLFRAHHNVHLGLDQSEEKGRVIDATAWPEMAELLLTADLLITDYSSCISDFVLQDRPGILYLQDRDEFSRDTRSFYFDQEQSPFFRAHDMAELRQVLCSLSPESVRENRLALDAFFGVNETGHSTDRVCEYIIDKLSGGKEQK